MGGRKPERPIAEVPRFALTRAEAAASLGMSVDTFERKVQPLIKVIPCGQLVLVPPAELERWVHENARYIAGGPENRPHQGTADRSVR